MKKITDFIVERKYIILSLFICITGICLYTSTKVNINFDIIKYLPNNSETKIGKDIMDNDFEKQKSSNLNVMFEGLTKKEKKETLNALKKVKGVNSVEYDDSKEYNVDEYTLYKLNVKDYDDSKKAKKVYEYVKNNFNAKAYSGSIYDENKPVLELWIVVFAIIMAMVILIIMSPSFIEPFLYLFTIGIAVFINKGTNIIFNNVSNITDSITAILQLALSMDYSIMLSNRYRQEKEKEKNNEKAMKKALYQSFKSISASSITTVVGLLALVFMSFTIGKDLGFVLAKGVILSLISIFFCLPGLLLIFDKAISKTAKKEPHFNLEKLGSYIYKTRKIQLVLIIIVFIVSYLLKGNLEILYTGSEQDEVAKVFKNTNEIAIVYENKYENIISDYCKTIEDNKNIDKVLCYGNTIGEKLAFDELNQQLSDLNQDTKIDEDLIKLVYYNYYNKAVKNKMTFNEFVNFIKKEIYTNDKFSKNINNEMKEKISLLEEFTSSELINKKRDSSSLANTLSMEEDDVKSILIYYNSKNLDLNMTIQEFVKFIDKDVLTNSKYSNEFNYDSKSLEQLTLFTNKNIINKEMTSDEISNILGIDVNLVDKLFLFYNTMINSKTKMTLNNFAEFALSISGNYKEMINDDTILLLKAVSILSDEEVINKKLSASEISNLLENFGLNEEIINQLYLFYATSDSKTKITIQKFVEFTSILKEDDIYKDYFSFEMKELLNTLANLLEYSNTPLPANDLYEMFKSDELDFSTVTSIVTIYGMNNLMTPQNFINILLNSGSITDTYTLAKLNKVKMIIENDNNEFSYQEMSTFLGLDINSLKTIYGVYDYNNGIKLNIKELIEFILINKENPLIKDQITAYIEKLSLAEKIIDNINEKFSYNELSNMFGIEENTLKNIYGLYDYINKETKMSPYEFINLILNNKDNALLKGKINNKTLNALNLVNTIMNSTMNNKNYSSIEMAKLLGIDSDIIDLLYSLYDSKYIKSNEELSILEFTDFIISDVIPNPKYNNKFDDKTISKLNTINGIMKNSLLGYKYNSKELFTIISNLSDDLSDDLIQLVYMYHGSIKEYDKSWKMTVEEFINYINDSILSDRRFKDFIDKDMKNKIITAQETIKDSKKLLVTDKYSRSIIVTKYPYESKKTFKFISDILDKVENNKGIYVIGDSPMALEMSKTFGDELDFITILTILFIFIIVAITFKSILIPIILVLVIQTAVYLTMILLSFMGGTVYFISLLIVQAILMGATIDYAIVYTSYYLESRKSMKIKDAIINSYNKSIHTILTSSSILIIVTLIVANFASAIAAKICETLSQGTLCSVLLILFILPGLLSTFDRFICKNGYKESKKKKIKQ